MNALIRALSFFRPDAARAAWAGLFMVLGICAGLLKPWPLAVIVDSVLEGKPFPESLEWVSDWERPALIAMLSAAVFVLHATQGMFAGLQNYISIRVGLCGLARVRNRLFSHLQRLSLRFYHGSNQGDVIYRASWDTFAFQTLFQQGCFTLIQASMTLLLMLVIMWQLNGRLTAVTCAIVPLLLVLMRHFGRQIRNRSLAAHQADSRLTSFVQQSIVAMPVVQSYTREHDEARRFADHAATSLDKRTVQHGWEVGYWFAIALVFGLAAAVITGYGSAEVLAARLTIGELLVFVAYLAQLYDPLNQLSHVGATVSEAGAGVQRVFELIDTAEEIRESPQARPIIAQATRPGMKPSSEDRTASFQRGGNEQPADAALVLRGEIQFDDVSFYYVPDRPVLSGVSFTLAATRSAALIGPSGAGKTTLLQLIPRFYDPTSGVIRLDGVDLRDVRLNDLRSRVAVVLQEPVLLAGTVAENIAYGRTEAGHSDIEAAARAAFADEFIRRLPAGYETPIGEGGARLSAGERQRISLARAFLKDAPILVLDEPTSALDAESERLVMAGLLELMRNRTTLIVAHRLQTIRSVDLVLVLEAGILVECGSQEQLIAGNGYYAKMIRRSSA